MELFARATTSTNCSSYQTQDTDTMSFSVAGMGAVAIDSTAIIPIWAQPSDSIFLYTELTLPAQGHLPSTSVSRQGDTVDVTSCFFLSSAPAAQPYHDSIYLDSLPAGNYFLRFTAHTTTDTTGCATPGSTARDSLNFSVGDSIPVVIDSMALMPPGPRSGDSVFLYTRVLMPNQGHWVSTDIDLQSDTVRVTGCYYNGGYPAIQLYEDTVFIDTLPHGNYFVEFVAQGTNHAAGCHPVLGEDRDSLTLVVANDASLGEGLRPSLSVFPNPSRGEVYVRISAPVSAVELTDVNGRKVRVPQRRISGGYQLDLSALPSGYYILHLHPEDGDVLVGKVMVE